jgi:cytochrome bd-type quinol oxidase subunit 2
MKYIRNFLLSIVLLLGLGGSLVPIAAYADSKATVCDAIGGCDTNTNGDVSVDKVVKVVINILSVIVGVIAVIMVIVGGARFMTANGDASSIANARRSIIYALIGLAVAALAQVIVHYVLAKVNG